MTPPPSSPAAPPPPPQATYRRDLGPAEVLAIVVGRIIGSGIFRTPGPMMATVGSVGLFAGAWTLGGALTLLSAVLYAELVAMLPRAGGPHAFLHAAFPPWWAFLRGWAMFFVSETASIAAVSLVFAEFAGQLLARALGGPLPPGTEPVLALLLIGGHTATQLRGVRLGGVLQDVFSAVKFVALAGVAAACLLAPGVDAPLATRTESPGTWAQVLSVFAAMRYAFFAYSGWEGATYVAEEVRDPEKNLPRSLLWGIGAVMGLYLLVNAGYVRQLGVGGMVQHGKGIAAAAMERAAGNAGAVFVLVAVVLSTLGNVGTQVMVKARVWQAMARDGLFFGALERLHPVHGTPNRALLAQAAWAGVLVLAATAAGRAYEAVIDFFSFTSAVFNVSVLLAVAVLRRRQPDLPRPYRAWGYPASLVVAAGLLSVFALVTLWDAPGPSLLGVLLTLTGLPYYAAVRRRAANRPGAVTVP